MFAGVGVAVGIGVSVGVGVAVADAVGAAVGVEVGTGVAVGLAVAVVVGVCVGDFSLGDGVLATVGVGVGAGVAVRVGVDVTIGAAIVGSSATAPSGVPSEQARRNTTDSLATTDHLATGVPFTYWIGPGWRAPSMASSCSRVSLKALVKHVISSSMKAAIGSFPRERVGA